MRALRRPVILGGLSILPFLSNSAGAQAPPPSTALPTLKERLDRADKNHDGKIDREEFFQVILEGFYFRDKDKKGYLVIEELREASPEAFKAANRKGDGRLTLEEYVNAVFIDFDKADTNRDGVLTYEEIDAYVRATRR